MAQKTYRKPELPPGTHVAQLVPDDTRPDALTPDRLVTCLNRGNKVLNAQHDAKHFQLLPAGAIQADGTRASGYFEVRFATARHLQTRLVVPGTRDPQRFDRAVSWIAIVGYDQDEQCRLFTKAELAHYGQSTEGLERQAMDSPSAKKITKMSMKDKGVRGAAASGSRRDRRRPDPNDQGTEEARERSRTALEKPTEPSSAERDAAERAAGR